MSTTTPTIRSLIILVPWLMLASPACSASDALTLRGSVPPEALIRENLSVTASLLKVGDYRALAIDLGNFNPGSAVVFDELDVRLVTPNGEEQTNDPLHPFLRLRGQRSMYEKTNGTYYELLHTLTNSVGAGNTSHFLGIFKDQSYTECRIKVTYYVPALDDRPVIDIVVPVGHVEAEQPGDGAIR